VVAPTEAVAGDLLRAFGLAPERCLVIPNGIAMDHHRPLPKDAVILSAGRLWDHAKNVRQLERVAGRVDWPIAVAGEACHPGDSEVFHAAHAMTGGVTWLGLLPPAALAERMATAAIYAAPARYEPFGLAILEAAATGCALVLGDIPSLRENWDGAAIFVAPDDDDELVRALNGLIASPDLRRTFADRALARSRGFAIERTADRYRRLYRTLVAAPEPVDA
jgi:glycosyltransferase involved in cell wall biosynthesis